MVAIVKGKAGFKRQVIDGAPIRDLAHLRSEKARGRVVHLVIAADQRMADAVAACLGLFDSDIGTYADHKLKGNNKRDYLLSACPHGLIYLGNSSADLPICAVDSAGALVGESQATRRRVARDTAESKLIDI